MNRRGFTLIEVMIALVLLAGVVLGIARTSGRMMQTVATSDRQLAAVQLASDRLEQIRLDPGYGTLASRYSVTESNIPAQPEMVRTTRVMRAAGAAGTPDYTLITVTVSGPGLPSPVSRTAAVGAP